MKPWREVAVPNPDVLEGTFLQSEFAAHITAANSGKATSELEIGWGVATINYDLKAVFEKGTFLR